MPGTPPTTPRLGVARFATTDPDQVPIDLNTIVDRLDVVAGRFESGLLAARPSTGAGIADRFYWATDTKELYRDVGGASPTWENVTRRDVPIVTSLPGSPYAGQQIVYRAATGVLWQLLYDATIADTYKWLVTGATGMQSEVATSETRTPATYADLTTVGPSVTLPLAGEYDITLETAISLPVATGTFAWASVALGAAAATDADAIFVQGSGVGAMPSRTIRRTLATAAATVKMQYRGDGTNVATFNRRHLMVRPVRVG